MTANIFTIARLSAIASQLRKSGKTIATTNGVFDIIHPGHIALLEKAKKQGDVLIVLLNSDASVKHIKGPSRPINSQKNRARVVAALRCVNYVGIFDEDDPRHALEKIKPDVHVKDATYGYDIIEAPIVKKHGGKIYLARKVKGHSTTDIIAKINRGKK